MYQDSPAPMVAKKDEAKVPDCLSLQPGDRRKPGGQQQSQCGIPDHTWEFQAAAAC